MGAGRPVVEILNGMLGVEHHGDHFVAAKPQEHAEVVSIPGFDLRALLVRPIVHGMVVVIFQHAEHIVQFRSRDEHHAGPVVDDARRTGDFFSAVARFELFHFHFAAFQGRVGFGALRGKQFVNPQKIRAALQFLRVARFGEFHVAVEGGERVRVQLGRLGLRALREVRGGQVRRRYRQQDGSRYSPVVAYGPVVAHGRHLSHHPVSVDSRSGGQCADLRGVAIICPAAAMLGSARHAPMQTAQSSDSLRGKWLAPVAGASGWAPGPLRVLC